MPTTRPDAVRTQLDETRARFDRVMAEAKGAVQRAIAAQEASALDRGDLDAAKRAREAAAAFQRGEAFDASPMPLVARAKRDYDLVAARAGREVTAAFDRAMAAYGRTRNLTAAEAVQAERAAFFREHGLTGAGLPEGLVLYYSFEPDTLTPGEGASLIRDASGSGLGASSHRFTRAEGRVGSGVAITGGPSVLETGDEPRLRLSAAFTVAAFAAFTSPGQSGTLVSKNDWNRGATSGFVLRLFNGRPDFTLGLGGWQSLAATALTPGSWHHLAGTFDGQRMRLFVDGKEAASRQLHGRLAVSDYPLTVGTDSFARDRLFEGAIDEVMLFNRALNDAEVAALAERH